MATVNKGRELGPREIMSPMGNSPPSFYECTLITISPIFIHTPFFAQDVIFFETVYSFEMATPFDAKAAGLPVVGPYAGETLENMRLRRDALRVSLLNA